MRTNKLILIVAVGGCIAGFLLPSPLSPAEPPLDQPPRIGVDMELPRQLGPFRQGEPEQPRMRCDELPATALCQSKLAA
jgi:hypothetical protein